jgi:nitrate reductase delta subunit
MSILRRTSRRSLDSAETASLLSIVSVLLDYPTPDTVALYPNLAVRAQHLPAGSTKEALTSFMGWWVDLPADEREQRYVAAFDFRRRTPLHLTYLTHGDTRNRGAALLQIKHVLLRHGYDISSGELPDYLPLLLEFAADEPRGIRLLGSHRRSLELLRRSLADFDDPFASLIAAVLAVLPRLDDADLAAVVSLAADGPPEESVGLDVYQIQNASVSGARR